MIERHFTGTPWEPEVGYCRALRVGDRILVSGTLGIGPDGGPAGDAYAQAAAALTRIRAAVAAVGGERAVIIRTRMFATDPAGDYPAIARAHREALGAEPPVTSLIGTPALVDPGFVVEIEAEAVVPE